LDVFLSWNFLFVWSYNVIELISWMVAKVTELFSNQWLWIIR
jgi:hypothetical protein